MPARATHKHFRWRWISPVRSMLPPWRANSNITDAHKVKQLSWVASDYFQQLRCNCSLWSVKLEGMALIKDFHISITELDDQFINCHVVPLTFCLRLDISQLHVATYFVFYRFWAYYTWVLLLAQQYITAIHETFDACMIFRHRNKPRQCDRNGPKKKPHTCDIIPQYIKGNNAPSGTRCSLLKLPNLHQHRRNWLFANKLWKNHQKNIFRQVEKNHRIVAYYTHERV